MEDEGGEVEEERNESRKWLRVCVCVEALTLSFFGQLGLPRPRKKAASRLLFRAPICCSSSSYHHRARSSRTVFPHSLPFAFSAARRQRKYPSSVPSLLILVAPAEPCLCLPLSQVRGVVVTVAVHIVNVTASLGFGSCSRSSPSGVVKSTHTHSHAFVDRVFLEATLKSVEKKTLD